MTLLAAQSQGPVIEPGPWTLLIDLDGTLLRQSAQVRSGSAGAAFGYALLDLMARQARERGMPMAMVRRRIGRVSATVWWRWGDYVEALGLDAQRFWAEADAQEARRSEPVAERLPDLLERLHAAGHTLVITSNNPTDGIAHKLRLIGLDTAAQDRLFTACFGTNNTRSNKAHRAFWRHVASGLRALPDRMMVLGNDAYEDGRVPGLAGITRWLPVGDLLHEGGEPSRPSPQAWAWPQVVGALEDAAGYAVPRR